MESGAGGVVNNTTTGNHNHTNNERKEEIVKVILSSSSTTGTTTKRTTPTLDNINNVNISVVQVKNLVDSVSVPTPPVSQPQPHSIIGSKNSAFQPYKAITVLTNLQRGNFKTLHKDVPTPLTFHEKAARGDLKPEEVNDSNLDQEDNEGKTALIWASYHAKLPTVKMLVEKGANVNYQGLSEETPLMYAASNARSQTHIDIIHYLIEAGADVDAADYEGNTPLIYATCGNHGPAITALLGKGASLTAVNENGDSAFNIAVAKGLHSAQNALETYLKEVIERNIIK